MAGKNESLALGDIVTLQRGTTYKSALLGQPGPVLLGLASIKRNGGFRDDNLKTYGGESPSKLLLKPGDVFVSLKDVTQSADLLGAVARVPPEIPSGRVTQDTVKLTFTRKDISPNYVYWMLRTPGYREYCRAHAIGTTNLSIARDDFLAYPIARPSTQAMVLVNTLDALDDKIELNRKMNETLEQMAQALFKSWFVDFDPVHAKAAGRQPAGMDKATADLFPDSFVDSELGKIPKGWRAASIYEIAEVIYGAPFASGLFNTASAGRPLVRIRDLASEEPAVFTTEIHPKGYLLKPGDIAVGMDGEFRAYLWAGQESWLNQRVCVFAPKPGFSNAFVRSSIIKPLAEVEATETATTVIHLGKNDIDRFKVVVPETSVNVAFAKTCQEWYNQIVSNRKQSRSLSELRDTLLPRLLSGGN